MKSLRIILRSLARRPTFTLTAVLTLALGIGATTAVFSVVSALLLRPLPYADPSELVAVWPGQIVCNSRARRCSEPGRSRWTAVGVLQPGVAHGAHRNRASRSSSPRRGFRATCSRCSASGPSWDAPFGMEAEEPGRDQVAVLSWETWRRAFGGSPDIVGKAIRLDGSSYTVVAVMPRGFRTFEIQADLWTPLTMDRAAMPGRAPPRWRTAGCGPDVRWKMPRPSFAPSPSTSGTSSSSRDLVRRGVVCSPSSRSWSVEPARSSSCSSRRSGRCC